MSAEQVVSVLAALACIVGAVLAVTHPDPRAAGAALLGTLVSLGVVYVGLSAPAVAALVLVATLFATVPFVVHLTVAAARADAADGPLVAGAAALVAATLFGILAVAIAQGELPVNVSLRSADAYDLAAVRDLTTGRSAAAAAVTVVTVVAALVATRAVRRHRPAA
jgi:NADH:ubiquinone oxidoreductase subunit 6 (subunit J)